MSAHIVIAIDGPSASGKSTNAKIIARQLGYSYVDTGAMYRTLAWHCLEHGIDTADEGAISNHCANWNTELACEDCDVRLLVDGYFPKTEIRTAETSTVVSVVAAVPFVRDWMKARQRDCIQFGNLVMEGRDIGSNIFPETPFKFYLDASPEERQSRRDSDGIEENLATRDQRDSTRQAAPLIIPEGAILINNSCETPDQTSTRIISEVDKLRGA